jgi:ParB-like chromosome segregation protein Spo0J
MVALDQIKPHPRNTRTHSKKQIRQIADSIRAVGFASPVLIDETGVLLAGHGRLEAARLLGLTTVPAIVIDGLTEARKRALLLADNRSLPDPSIGSQQPKLKALSLRLSGNE